MKNNCLEKYFRVGNDFEKDIFENPPCELFPVYSWLWTGKITKAQIKTQLSDMQSAGINAFYILPLPSDFSPAKMATTLSPEYLSDEFFELVEFTANTAKKLGMSMWLYDEGGWPSGNACEQVVKKAPDLAAKKLVKTQNGYELQIRYYPYTLTPKPHYADSASAEANDIFIDLTYKPYKQKLSEHFGSYLPIMFTDEPAIRYPALPDGARELYSERYGENIEDAFPAVFGDEKNDRLRIQYCTVVSDIFRKNYFEKLHGFCKQSGIYFSGHLNMDNTLQGCHINHYGSQLQTLRCFDIPGIDVIWRQIYPFSNEKTTTAEYDNVTDYPFFPRLAASAANQNGTNLAVSESLAIYGHGVTSDIIRYVANYQYVRGINLINLMTVPYQQTGSLPFISAPMFYKHRPDYTHLRKVNLYLARMTYLCTLGTRDADTALVMPLEDVYAGGEREKAALDSFCKTGEMLEKNFVDFDIIDKNSIAEASVQDGLLRIGNAKYKSVILPKDIYLEPVLLKKLESVGSDILPVLSSTSPHIRVMRRRLRGGTPFYFVFNQSTEQTDTSLNVPDLENPCVLDPETGEIYQTDLENITIPSGAVLVLTENVFSAKPKKQYTNEIPLTDFVSKPIDKLVLGKNGVSTMTDDLEITTSFSGKICYLKEIDLDVVPTHCAISFEKLYYSAEVCINGRNVGIVSLAPYLLEIPENTLVKGKNIIEITVANTPANAYSAFDYESVFEPRFLGGYNQKQREFEKDTLELPHFVGARLEAEL